jgi:hypothetical protein
MIESIDVRLREIGISDTDVQNRLDGKDKALVITDQDIVYVDSSGLQRAALRYVTKVITDKTGTLTIRSSNGPAIEGGIRGFDVTELKVFFEGVKTAIARAKTAPGPVQTSPQIAPDGHDIDAPSAHAHPSVPSEPHLEAHVAPLGQTDPLLMSTPAPAMDPWESLSTSRPTLEMPAAPGVLPGFPEDFDTKRSEFGRASADSLDWDESIGDPTASHSAAALRASPDEDHPLLEPDDLPHPTSVQDPNHRSTVQVTALSTPEGSVDALDQPAPSSLEESPAPMLADHYAISPVARWLKILAIPLGLIGIAAGALSVPATDAVPATGASSILQWLQVAGFIIGGLSAALIAYGIGDLLSIWSSMAADIRALRHNKTR